MVVVTIAKFQHALGLDNDLKGKEEWRVFCVSQHALSVVPFSPFLMQLSYEPMQSAACAALCAFCLIWPGLIF